MLQSNFREAAKLAEIEDDEPLGVEIDGVHIALYRLHGKIFATENICPHQFALLSDGYMDEREGSVECPLHQARFDIRTGAVLCGPTERQIMVFPVQIEDDRVYVDVSQA